MKTQEAVRSGGPAIDRSVPSSERGDVLTSALHTVQPPSLPPTRRQISLFR